MSELQEKIKPIIEKMQKYRSLYEQNEQAVRDQIVTPILKALGWNTESPDEVQPNVSMEEGIPDFTLILTNKKILFIEVKKLSLDVDRIDIIRQLAKYCFGEGLEYGVLTNGSLWMLFRAFQKNTSMTERIVWKVDLENDSIVEAIRKFNTIIKGNIKDIDNLIKKLQILDEIWQSLLDEPKNLTKGFVSIFDQTTKESHPNYKFEQFEIEDFLNEKLKGFLTHTEVNQPEQEIEEADIVNNQIRKMKIENVSFEVRNSYDILINAAEWLIKKGKLRKDSCPVTIGPKRNLVNTVPKHRYGNDFRAPKILSNNLYIETHYSTASCIAYARKLLGKFGYDENILQIN